MKSKFTAIIIFLLIVSHLSISQSTRIIANSYLEKSFATKSFSFQIELKTKDSISIVSHPANLKYDTLNFYELDSISLLNKLKVKYNEFNLISYSKYNEKGGLVFEQTTEFKDFIEPNTFEVKKTYYDKLGEIQKIEFSEPNKLYNKIKGRNTITTKEIWFKNGKLYKEVAYGENVILEIKIYYETGILNEITHYKDGQVVGKYEYYALNGELVKLIIYDNYGKIINSFERYNGGFKLNDNDYNDFGEIDK